MFKATIVEVADTIILRRVTIETDAWCSLRSMSDYSVMEMMATTDDLIILRSHIDAMLGLNDAD